MCEFNFFRFGSQHLTPSGRNIINISLYEKYLKAKSTVNHLDKSIQFNLRKRCYDFSKSGSVIAKYDKCKGKISNGNSKNNVEQNENSKQQRAESGEDNTFCPVDADAGLICEIEPENISESENCTDGGGAESSHNSRKCGAITDEDVIQVRKEEKKQVLETVIYIFCSKFYKIN